jgi:hypothetical protein
MFYLSEGAMPISLVAKHPVDLAWYLYPAVVAAGFIAGFITLAGSGSLVSLPLFIFIGLPANVANATKSRALSRLWAVITEDGLYCR